MSVENILDDSWYSGLEDLGSYYDWGGDWSYGIGDGGSTQAVFNVDEGLPDLYNGGGFNLGSMLNFLTPLLGTGLAAAGKSTSSTPTKQTAAGTIQTPLTAESQQLAATMQGLLPLLMRRLSLNPAQQGIYGQMTGGGLQSYLNPIPAGYTDALKSLIAPTQQAMETSTSQALNRMAPRTLSLGPQVQNIISEVASTNTEEKQLAKQIYQYLADQAMTANTGYGQRAGAAMQLAGAPQTQQAAGISSIEDLLTKLITIYQGGAPQTQNEAITKQTQPVSFTSGLMSNLGGSLLNNPNTLSQILQLFQTA